MGERERESEGEQRAAAGGKHVEEGGAENRSERREARSIDEDAESNPTATAGQEGSKYSRDFSPMLESNWDLVQGMQLEILYVVL